MQCPHNATLGDNYGTTCADCGARLSGFGYWGDSNTCLHEWSIDPVDRSRTCVYCEYWEPGNAPTNESEENE